MLELIYRISSDAKCKTNEKNAAVLEGMAATSFSGVKHRRCAGSIRSFNSCLLSSSNNAQNTPPAVIARFCHAGLCNP